jgi:cell division septum initiation protein DivIVA
VREQMETLEKLQSKLNRLLTHYEDARADNERLLRENQDLKKQLKAAGAAIAELKRQNKVIEKTAAEKNQGAVKRISKLVERIEELQGEIEFS